MHAACEPNNVDIMYEIVVIDNHRPKINSLEINRGFKLLLDHKYTNTEFKLYMHAG